MEGMTPLAQIKASFQAMMDDRINYLEDWKALAQYFLPTKSRYLSSETEDTNKGMIRSDILDSTGVKAVRIAQAGLHGGMTSQTRPWFRLTFPDPALSRRRDVKEWLHLVEKNMRNVFANRSNFYSQMGLAYQELLVFGTDFMFATPTGFGPNFGIKFDALTAGEYAVGSDEMGRVNAVARKKEFTAAQYINAFGRENCPELIRTAANDPSRKTNRFMWHHLVMPRQDRTYGKMDSKNKPWGSWYWHSGSGDQEGFLRESGFDMFPGLGIRWAVTGSDDYGSSPAADVLCHARMLNSMKFSWLAGLQRANDPPIVTPGGMDHADLMPGGVNPVNATGQQGNAVYPAYLIDPRTQETLVAINDTRQQIQEGLYNDLFLMIAQTNKIMTATEVAERQEEKLTQLGPVLEHLIDEGFIPLIDLVFYYMIQNGFVPPPPEDLAASGVPIKVEFISILAQALKLVLNNSMNQFIGFVGNATPIWPEMRHVVKPYNVAADYADGLGVNVTNINSEEDYLMAVQMEREAQQRQLEMAQIPEMAKGVKHLSQSDTSQPSALADLLAAGGER